MLVEVVLQLGERFLGGEVGLVTRSVTATFGGPDQLAKPIVLRLLAGEMGGEDLRGAGRGGEQGAGVVLGNASGEGSREERLADRGNAFEDDELALGEEAGQKPG